MIEIGYSQQTQQSIIAGQGAAATTGGSLSGAHVGTDRQAQADALVAPQAPSDIITSTAADVTTPEANRQYNYRDLQSRLPPVQCYAVPCIWGDLEYWMDS